MDIYLIRHGITEGNLRKAYVGITDQPLTQLGIEKLGQLPKYHPTDSVYVSPLLRTRQTAEILFPGVKQVVLEPMREMDFGIFENKNYEDLAENPEYRQWVEGNCEGVCPQGEGIVDFAKRVVACFLEVVEAAIKAGESQVTFVVHGGVIMSIAYTLATEKRSFYQWWIDNGACFHFEYQQGRLMIKN